MRGLFFYMALAVAIVALGIAALYFLLNRYRDKLLNNFGQKIWMTALLGSTYAALFLLLNSYLERWVLRQSLRHSLVENFAFLVGNPWFFIKFGLAFFLFNACLILAFRSLYKRFFLF